MESKEVWRAIPGQYGAYEASDKGRIRSLDRYIEFAGSKVRYLHKGRVLQPVTYPSGHLAVRVFDNKRQYVHRLVLLAFVGVAPELYECRHLNGNPADNSLANLMWGTRSENILDRMLHRQ